MWRMDGKTVLVSGSARGMGEATVRLLASCGANVVIGDLLEAQGRRVAEEIGPHAVFGRLDVSEPGSWDELVSLAQHRFGRLDALVNNAGIEKTGEIGTFSLEDYQRLVAVNQTGVWLGMKTVLPVLRQAGGGAIVNISSVAGFQGIHGYSAYCATKWAVRGMTKAAALELGTYGIRVNSIHPGTVDTPMNSAVREHAAAFCDTLPVNRMGTATDIAQMVAFLISDASSYCTGSEFIVDGGLLAGPRYQA